MKKRLVEKIATLIYNGGCNEHTTAEVVDMLKKGNYDIERLDNLIYFGGCNVFTTAEAIAMIRKEVKI
ncbi:MAG: hypothetical protein DRI61_11510 [Chloroflexi bacterium]|nr:MAG: hypothetical protein DRI61_11510 [Chloroflexota bacterium]